MHWGKKILLQLTLQASTEVGCGNTLEMADVKICLGDFSSAVLSLLSSWLAYSGLADGICPMQLQSNTLSLSATPLFFPKSPKWQLWGAMCCSGHLILLALEWEIHGPGVKLNPFQPWSRTVLQMLATSCCASISFGEGNGSPGADKENPKKPPQQTNLKVIFRSNVVNLMEENGRLPCELTSGRVVALSGGSEGSQGTRLSVCLTSLPERCVGQGRVLQH